MEDTNFWDRFEQLCSDNNTTPHTVCKKLNYSNSIATYWKQGTTPKGDALLDIADYFNVSIDYLLGRTEQATIAPNNTYTLSDQEQGIINSFRLITQEDKSHIKSYLDFLVQRNESSIK